MPTEDSFDDVMARLRTGDADAATQVFQRFAGRLIVLARGHLDARLRRKVDPEDLLQSAFQSFFHRHREGRFQPENWGSLWSLLIVITLRKCGGWARRFQAARRALSAEVTAAGSADESAVIEAFSAEPSPAEAVMLSEVVERLLRDLGPRDGEILTLALQGYSAAEISDQLHRPARTVYRVLERIKARLQASPEDATRPRD
jgi:RNA polymerase sigma-70 factor (ECF subfamily)